MPSHIGLLLNRLDHVRPSGKDRWTARCPAHEDRDPSLSIAVTPDDRILLHCHAGCGGADVVAAIGLSLSDLFPEPLDHHLPSMQRRPVTPINIKQEAKTLNEIVDAFRRTGRILNRSVLEQWAGHFVEIMAHDKEDGVPIRPEDVALLAKIRSTILRSSAI